MESNRTGNRLCYARATPLARNALRSGYLGAPFVLLWCTLAIGQQMEPRSYSAVPIGTNFAAVSYQRSSGDVLFDPSLPVTNVQASLNAYTLGYSHSFGIAGHTASVALSVPYANADLTGDVEGQPGQVYRSGLGDMRFRIAVNFLGDPALSPSEFSQRSLSTLVGASVTVEAPTGQYVPSRYVNVGSNRWAIKPELGFSQPIGNWFFESSAGVWIFTDNSDFFGGRQRTQDPLPVLQWHVGYIWRPGLWLAADVTYFTGGRTSINGVADQDLQSNVRYGITLSIPIATHWSAKLAWSHGLVTTVGGNFETVSVALQYRWFSP